MPSLREIQRQFAAAVVAGGSERMAVYRRTVRANYRNAMSATYPAVRRIVGTTFFLDAVDAYVEANPSRSGDLNEYGDAFGEFLGRCARAADLPYLPDVARLEWAIDEANRATDAPCEPDAVLGALARVDPTELPQARLTIEPSCRLLSSAFPLLRIWQVNQPDYDGDLAVDFAVGADHLRVRREQARGTGGIVIERVTEGDFHWLSALNEHTTLAAAIDRACNADATFDLQAALQRYIGDGTIALVGERAA